MKNRTCFSAEEKKKIFQAYQLGLTLKQISEVLGVNINTLHDWEKTGLLVDQNWANREHNSPTTQEKMQEVKELIVQPTKVPALTQVAKAAKVPSGTALSIAKRLAGIESHAKRSFLDVATVIRQGRNGHNQEAEPVNPPETDNKPLTPGILATMEEMSQKLDTIISLLEWCK